jgi:excinuclease ABC subunit C
MDTNTIPCRRDKLVEIPTTNGVYIFEENGTPLYIGKSINLKARLISHFENAKVDPKASGYVDHADTIRYHVTDSEFKALLLEAKLIRRHMPKYNVRWRDDKSYLYIKATVKEDFPRFYITRKEDDKKALYFGPFPSVRSATNVLREIRKVFPFCTQKAITKNPCFYAKIRLCDPCPNVIVQTEDKTLKKELKKKYRDNIRKVIKVLDGNVDLVVKQLYDQITELTKDEKYEEAIPLRDRLYRLEGIVLRRSFDRDHLEEYNKSGKSMEALLHILGEYFPTLTKLERIECFDMSTFAFKQSTASMVVFTNGISDKKEYKRFKIKNEKAESDFEMMDEVVRRRFKNKWQHPDLLVVDGGKPQVRTTLKVLAEMNIDVPLIGIAKRPDRFVLGIDNLPSLRPPQDNPGFRMIQAIRDESHRFAKKYHVLLRDKNML